MGLKDDNARLIAEMKTAQREIERLKSWKDGLPIWAKRTSNYPTLEALIRYESYREKLQQDSTNSAHQRILASEGQEDLT